MTIWQDMRQDLGALEAQDLLRRPAVMESAPGAMVRVDGRSVVCLCSNDYLDSNPHCRGVLKNGQIGRAKNAYTSWGDYFLMEALAVELRAAPTFW